MSEDKQPALAHTSLGPIEYLEREDNHRDPLGTILAIHGAMGGYEQSDILGKSVGPEGYRYISVSRPGYLKTPLKGRESPEDQADLFEALLDELGVSKVTILAVSGGGYSALHFALRHPDRCEALILCSTIGGINAVPIPFAFNLMKFAAQVPLFIRFMRNRFVNNIETSLRRSISHQDIVEKMMGDDQMMKFYKELTLSTMDSMAERIPGTLNDIRITKNTQYPLEDISVPTLIIHGTDDPVVPYNDHGRKLAERIQGAKLCLAERGEHMTIFTHNEQVKSAINSFLGSI